MPWEVHLNVDNAADLKLITESGLIWRTKYAQRAIDAIRLGDVKVADCKDMPDTIRAALIRERAKGAR